MEPSLMHTRESLRSLSICLPGNCNPVPLEDKAVATNTRPPVCALPARSVFNSK